MKKLMIIFMLLIPVFAYALFPCQQYEYSELKDMDQATLEVEYCKVFYTTKEKIDFLIKTDDKMTWKEVDTCTNTLDKMKRVYKQKFNKDMPLCPDKAKKEKEVWPDRIEE